MARNTQLSDNSGKFQSGSEGTDTIIGGNGRDRINSLGGDDLVDGGRGDDLINGGAGNDFLVGGYGDDTVFGDEGNDILTDWLGQNMLFGGLGDDEIHGGDGWAYGGAGNDAIYAVNAVGGDGDDQLWGDASAASNLNGGAGQDAILAASTGDDTLAGGAGPDAFYFLASDRGVDTVTDFNVAEDILNFMDFNITQDTVYYISEQVGADTVIHLDLVSGCRSDRGSAEYQSRGPAVVLMTWDRQATAFRAGADVPAIWHAAAIASNPTDRRRNDEHQIEKVGEKLRAMMPWISKGKMVDRARN